MQWHYQMQYIKAALFCASIGFLIIVIVGLATGYFKIPEFNININHKGYIAEPKYYQGY